MAGQGGNERHDYLVDARAGLCVSLLPLEYLGPTLFERSEGFIVDVYCKHVGGQDSKIKMRNRF